MKKYNSTFRQKEEYLSSLTVDLQELKAKHDNRALSDLVKNSKTDVRIYEDEGELVQKIYPIYQNRNNKQH